MLQPILVRVALLLGRCFVWRRDNRAHLGVLWIVWRRAICDFANDRSPRLAEARRRAAAYAPPTWSSHFDKVRVLLDDLVATSPVTIAQRARRVLGSAALIGRQGGPDLSRPTDGGSPV